MKKYRVIHDENGYKLQKRKYFLWSDFALFSGKRYKIYFKTESSFKEAIENEIRDELPHVSSKVIGKYDDLFCVKTSLRR